MALDKKEWLSFTTSKEGDRLVSRLNKMELTPDVLEVKRQVMNKAFNLMYQEQKNEARALAELENEPVPRPSDSKEIAGWIAFTAVAVVIMGLIISGHYDEFWFVAFGVAMGITIKHCL